MDSHAREPCLLALWRVAADDLNLEVVAPFELKLPSGARIEAPLLVRGFGAAEGMLVLSDYGHVVPWVEDIVEAGYGFAVMSEPDPSDKYLREVFIELLRDWGWAGVSQQPAWL